MIGQNGDRSSGPASSRRQRRRACGTGVRVHDAPGVTRHREALPVIGAKVVVRQLVAQHAHRKVVRFSAVDVGVLAVLVELIELGHEVCELLERADGVAERRVAVRVRVTELGRQRASANSRPVDRASSRARRGGGARVGLARAGWCRRRAAARDASIALQHRLALDLDVLLLHLLDPARVERREHQRHDARAVGREVADRVLPALHDLEDNEVQEHRPHVVAPVQQQPLKVALA
mmetsp:Transcript_14499/g.37582  ORF Transcript_14499/g.37582 Transcript_14499/m.37582 type:complete len:235 (+) Transcript_14499:247-951(+)